MRKARQQKKKERNARKYGVVSRCAKCGKKVIWWHRVICNCRFK